MLTGALTAVLFEAIAMFCSAFRRIAEFFLLVLDKSENEMETAGIQWEPELPLEALKAKGMSPEEIGEYRLTRLRRLLEKVPPTHRFWQFLRRQERLGMVLHLFVLTVLFLLPICFADDKWVMLAFAIMGLMFMICFVVDIWIIFRSITKMIDAEETMSLRDLQEGVNDNEDGFARAYERYLTRNMTRKRRTRSLLIGLGTVVVVLTAMIVDIPRFANRIVPSPSTPGVFSSGQYSFLVQEDGTACILSYAESRRKVEVPGAFGEYTVTAIGEEAFKDKELKAVTLPETVARIGKRAFLYCRELESVDHTKVKEIEAEAFESCRSLEKVLLGEGLQRIGGNAFYGTSIAKVTVPASVKQVGKGAFGANHFLSKVTFLGSDTRLEGNPVARSNSASVVFPAHSGYVATADCIISADGKQFIAYLSSPQKTSYSVPDGVEVIAEAAFQREGCLKTVHLPDSLVQIEAEAFSYCIELERVELPKGLLEIGARAFMNCRKLKKADLPQGIVSLGEYCFLDCKSLMELVIPITITSVDLSQFDGCEELTLTLPATITDIQLKAYFAPKIKLVRVVRGSYADKALRQAGIRMQYYDPNEPTP